MTNWHLGCLITFLIDGGALQAAQTVIRMTELIQDYARIGIVHFMAYKACLGGEGPILETLEKIALDLADKSKILK